MLWKALIVILTIDFVSRVMRFGKQDATLLLGYVIRKIRSKGGN